MNKNEMKNGPLPIQVQCKTQTRAVNYTKLLDQMPPGKNVIFHQFTKKSEKAGRFIPKGEYAIMDLDFFIELITAWKSDSGTSTNT